MSEQNPVPSGAPDDASGDEGNKPKDTVSYDTHRKLLDEKKRVQERARLLEEKLQQIENEKAQQQKEELEKQGNFQKLLEQERAEKKRLLDEHQGLVGSVQRAQKVSAVLRHINGKLDDVVIEKILSVDGVALSEDGDVVEDTAKLVAQEFEQKFPHFIRRADGGATLPNGAANPGKQGKLSYQEWISLPDSKEMKKRMKDVDWTTA